MKKLATLLLAAGMVVAASAPANAVDVNLGARYRTSFATGQKFDGNNREDIRHRMRLELTMAASENLSAFAQFQINHQNQWGNTDKHGFSKEFANDPAKRHSITARMMYLDWTVPGTAVKVRSGRWDLGLPGEAFGQNSILGAGYGSREGVVISAPVNANLGLTALWARLATDAGVNNGTTGVDLDRNNTDDMYAVAANLKFDGVSGAVYAAFATLDDEVTGAETNGWAGGRPAGSGTAYWAGFTTKISMFDPFTLKLSAAYGSFEADNSANDTDGWNVQAKASYALPFGSAVLGGWYFSGADKDGDGWMPNSGYFNGTKHYYDGYACLSNFQGNTNNDGTWAVQAGIEGMSFISGLAHDFLVTYVEGTNDKLSGHGTFNEDDAFVEIDLNTTYKIYKNLTARLELAYIITDFSDETKAAKGDDDDWFAGLTFDFRF